MLARRFILLVATQALGCSETGMVLGPPEEQPPDAGGSRPLAASSVTAGLEHTCALFAFQVACWGANRDGQLGVGDFEDRLRPVTVELSGVSFISAGERFTCALDELGDVHCWGSNDRGQLGIGTRQSSATPVRVPLPGRAVTLSTGFAHTCAILEDATLWCFGQNGEGELGQSDPYPGDTEERQRMADQLSPIQVPGAFREVDCGQGHTCAIRSDGSLWCWGRNSQSQLGVGGAIQFREPQRVGSDTDWQNLEAGMQYTCALRSNRSLWCWGENSGEGNIGVDVGTARVPTRVGMAESWIALATNRFHSCAIDAAFDLYCFGRNVEGQLGVGDTDVRRTPALVGSGFSSVAAGAFHTCAVRRDGGVACAGKADRGQLGNGGTERAAVLTGVEPP